MNTIQLIERKSVTNPLLSPILGYAARLRFRTLFLISASLFVLDVLIPDLIPFIDEILLGLLTLLLSAWKKPGQTPNSNSTKQD